ncbi:MAG: zinc transporter ZntB [Pseudomonadota bacterium]
MTTDHIILAHRLTPYAGLAADAFLDALREEAPAWGHLDAGQPAVRDWLEEVLAAEDPIVLDALLAPSTRPVFVQHGAGAVLILRGVNLNAGADPEDMISLRLWADARGVISMGLRKLRAVEDLDQQLAGGQGPGGSGALVAALAGRICARMEPTLEALDDVIADLEQSVLDAPKPETRAAIATARRRAIVLRRYLAPQREALMGMAQSDLSWLDAGDRRELRFAADRMARYVEDLDALRERAQVIAEELANTLSQRLDRNLYVLSIVSAIFLPLGFLTGLLGINVGGVPGVESGAAFWVVTAGLAALGVGALALFRWLRWF